MAITTPLQNVRNAIYNILKNSLTGVSVYKRMPTTGVKPNSVVITNVAGGETRLGLSEIISTGEKGIKVNVTFQIDVWTSDIESNEAKADEVLYTLWSKQSELKASNVENIVCRAIRDMPAGEIGEKLYRKVLDFDCYTLMSMEA
jgi:hypothetical protein